MNRPGELNSFSTSKPRSLFRMKSYSCSWVYYVASNLVSKASPRNQQEIKERLTVRESSDLLPGISAGSVTSTMNLLGTVFLNPLMLDGENFAASAAPTRAAETRAEVAVLTMLGNHWQATRTSTHRARNVAAAL